MMYSIRRAAVAAKRIQYASMLPLRAPRLFLRLFHSGFYRQIHDVWLDDLDPQPGSRVAEIGCGPGEFAGRIASRGPRVTGVDRSAQMIAAALSVRQEGMRFVVGNAEQLPLADETMDLSVASSLLNVVPDPVQVLAEMARVTRGGGRISVLLPTTELTVETARTLARKMTVDDAALIELWTRSCRKVEPSLANSWFVDAGLPLPESTELLGGAVLVATSHKTRRSSGA